MKRRIVSLILILLLSIASISAPVSTFAADGHLILSESYNQYVTNEVLLDLFMLYLKAEKTKKESEDKRSPIPYYLIDCFAKYECKDRRAELITSELADISKILHIIKLYKAVSSAYAKEYAKKFNVDYNKMIKQNVNYEILENLRDTLKDVI